MTAQKLLMWDNKYPGSGDVLQDFLNGGMSASAIARELSEIYRARITRNAVIGRARRAGLKFINPPCKHHRPQDVPERSVPERRLQSMPKPRKRRLQSRPKPPTVPSPPPATAVAAASRVPPIDMPENPQQLLDLGNSSCRWPFGDPQTKEFWFCGRAEADMTGNRPYCREHAAMAIAKRLPAT